MPDKLRIARALAIFARAVLVLITVFWGGFALLSGVGDEQDVSLWQNLPNAAPWVGLALVVIIAFKWPGRGGALVLLVGLASVPFFNAWASPVMLLGVSLPVILLGGMLLLSAYLARG